MLVVADFAVASDNRKIKNISTYILNAFNTLNKQTNSYLVSNSVWWYLRLDTFRFSHQSINC